jgi:hypothetical protein
MFVYVTTDNWNFSIVFQVPSITLILVKVHWCQLWHWNMSILCLQLRCTIHWQQTGDPMSCCMILVIFVMLHCCDSVIKSLIDSCFCFLICGQEHKGVWWTMMAMHWWFEGHRNVIFLELKIKLHVFSFLLKVHKFFWKIPVLILPAVYYWLVLCLGWLPVAEPEITDRGSRWKSFNHKIT